MSQRDLIALLDTPEATDMDVEQWLAFLPTREHPQEAEYTARLDAFYDEICSMVS